jgi:tetratricopeptide (TPR) repeat protein
MKNKVCLAMAALILVVTMVFPNHVFGEAPYSSYVYNEWEKSKASPSGYLPNKVYTGMDAGTGHFNEPQDLFVGDDNRVYVADTGNNRIVVLNDRFERIEVIEKLSFKGKEVTLTRPTGLFVNPEGTIYIAEEKRVLRVNLQKEIELVIEQPSHPLIAKDFQFKPVKVAADEAGRIYILSEGQFFGLMQFDSDGNFLRYFGSNKVEVTPYVVLETFWKSILSEKQREGMAKLLPIEYSNLDIGQDGFIYTTTIVSQNSREEIKKLNPLGNNVLNNEDGAMDFGDKELTVKQEVKKDTSFVDLTVHREGFIAGLDRTRGRVFEYDADGNPVAVFGAIGNQQGTFQQPSAVAYMGDSVLVLDAGKRNITSFKLTEYGELVHRATELYNQGHYEDAAMLWHKAAKSSIHNGIAYIGIAKALEKEERYDEALPYYKLGAERGGYSETFSQIRIRTVRDHMPLIMSLFGLALVGYYGFKAYRFAGARRRRRNKHEAAQSISEQA